ncbi:MAG: hypothetical protein M3071_05070, partial [Actinomycetota bacterium]|nr:hypothetical protein [Actinomycetota bacterium]
MSGPSTRVTERDHRILDFVAEHRIVLAAHVQELLGVSETIAYRRLRGLTERGLLEHSNVLYRQPGWYQITRSGLKMIESDLPPPRVDLSCYRHDIGIAWVWLAASRGAFGRVDQTVSEREMRSRDAAYAAADRAAAGGGERALDTGEDRRPPYGVHLGGVGPRGQARLHYPDLLLIGRSGERVAVELELTAKGRRRLETILAGYGSDPSIAAVLYLTERPGIGREVRSAAARLGISDLVHVHPVVWAPGAEPRPAVARGRTRRAAAREDSV